MVEEKTLAFRKQLQSIKDEERRLRRAIRIIEVNPSIVSDGNSESELETLRRSLALKEETVCICHLGSTLFVFVICRFVTSRFWSL